MGGKCVHHFSQFSVTIKIEKERLRLLGTLFLIINFYWEEKDLT